MRDSLTKSALIIVIVTFIVFFIAQGIIVDTYMISEKERLDKSLRDYVAMVELVYDNYINRVEYYENIVETINATTDATELEDVVRFTEQTFSVKENYEDLQLMLGELEHAGLMERLIVYDHSQGDFLTRDYNIEFSFIDMDTINDRKIQSKNKKTLSSRYSEKNNLTFILLREPVDVDPFRLEELESVNELVYSLDHRHRVDIMEENVIIYSSNADAVGKSYRIRDYYSKRLLIDTLEYDQSETFYLSNSKGGITEYMALKTVLQDRRVLVVIFDNRNFDSIVSENVMIIRIVAFVMSLVISLISIFLYTVFIKYYSPFDI